MKYQGWFSPRKIYSFRAWLFHRWNDYDGMPFEYGKDGLRILGFEWLREG